MSPRLSQKPTSPSTATVRFRPHNGRSAFAAGTALHAPLRSLLSTRGGRRSQIKRRASSPQSGNLRVGPQLPCHIVTAGPEDDAGGAPGFELSETLTQLLAGACEGHLFGGGYVDERVMAVRNVAGMTAVNGEVADFFVRTFDAGQPRFAVRQRFH